MAGIPTKSQVREEPEPTRPLVKYRVLLGHHYQTDPDGVERMYLAGPGGHDIFESSADMLRMNGGGGMQPKFELVGDGSYIPAQGAVWDPSKESIDAFSARMKATAHAQEQEKLAREQGQRAEDESRGTEAQRPPNQPKPPPDRSKVAESPKPPPGPDLKDQPRASTLGKLK